ncbi:MAG: radical SAM protein [Deltaproteobacteria bacterium]|nr:radical SAM protein [Deltaproteobacteria bacterium]
MVDHVFRFPIRPGSHGCIASLHDLLGHHLKELLRLLAPVSGEESVRINGYRLLNDPGGIYPLPRERLSDCFGQVNIQDFCEPRLEYFQNLIESILGFIDFEVDGQVVHVDGFRLNKLSPWLVPGGGASDLLAGAASRCNLNCRFCYNAGTSTSLRFKPRDPDEEFEEILSRIKQYVPQGRLHIFPGIPGPCEVLAHPHIIEILRALRAKTVEPLRIATNGSLLTPKMIESLREFAPLFLDISLNSASLGRRRWLMRDHQPEVAINALDELAKSNIPFSVVIVPWPFPSRKIMLDDLRETVGFADSHESAFIQVSLPGYSRFFSESVLFNHDAVWESLKSEILQLRGHIGSPLIIRPGLFEEFEDPDRVNAPMIIGTVKNSPAARAGLQCGDRITRINGLRVKSRHQARSLLTILHQSTLNNGSITIERKKTTVEIKIPLSDYAYPYEPETSTHLGAVFSSSGIPDAWIEGLQKVIISHRASSVLVLSSRLVAPSIKKFLLQAMLPSGIEIHVCVPDNSYWGGNIFMGDLLVVQDFIDAIKKFIGKEGVCPDLVAIPASPFHLSGWGRDLTGRLYMEIEEETGIKVALVKCNPLFD